MSTIKPTPPSEEERVASDRLDFIKRLFAVTLSVGVANQLYRMMNLEPAQHYLDLGPFVEKYWPVLLLLFVSTAAVVLSWEGYTSSLARPVVRNPVEKTIRFYLEIAIVVAYLILTLSAQFFVLWFNVLAIIFALYILWDVVPVFFIRADDLRYKGKTSIPSSITITATWLVYFGLVAHIQQTGAPKGFVFAALAALVGVIMYRVIKLKRPDPLIVLLIGAVSSGLLVGVASLVC